MINLEIKKYWVVKAQVHRKFIMSTCPEQLRTSDSVDINSSLRRLSAEELESRRKEMMGFAREREEERDSNVQRYKRQDEQEKERESKTKHRSQATFIQ